jgi:hypothetical protein
VTERPRLLVNHGEDIPAGKGLGEVENPPPRRSILDEVLSTKDGRLPQDFRLPGENEDPVD